MSKAFKYVHQNLGYSIRVSELSEMLHC